MNNETGKKMKLGIAGIILEFIGDDDLKLTIAEPHNRFLVSEGEPDLSLKVHYGDIPEFKFEETLFDSRGVWALYRTNGNYEIALRSAIEDSRPYQVAVINQEFNHGDLYVRPFKAPGGVNLTPRKNGDRPRVNPTGYPLDELLIMNLLARGHGVELHGCGIVVDGIGYLFSGVSGAGKSTMANIWRTRKQAEILSDDRIIIRRVDGQFHIFGTPWHGDARIASPHHAPLKKIMIIKHSPENRAMALRPGDIASRLLVRCFPTFFDQTGMLNTLGVLGEIIEEVPCFELGFVPDDNIIDFVNSL